MSNPILQDRCLSIAQELANQEGWPLPKKGINLLVEAILPFVQQTSNWAEDDERIRTIARYYYQDGPRLWEEWRMSFIRWARLKGISESEIEDFVQSAYLRMQSALRGFKFQSALNTYFYSVFMNLVREKKSRDTRFPSPKSSFSPSKEIDDILASQPADTLAPEELALDKETATEIKRLVEEEIRAIANDKDFQILTWYYVEKSYLNPETQKLDRWTDKRIAEKLNMKAGTVTLRRRRALPRIQKKIMESPEIWEQFRPILENLDIRAP